MENVADHVGVLARAKNLELGCRVAAVRAVRGVRKGGQGILRGLAKEATVEWEEGALTDVKGEGPHERLVGLASIEVLKVGGTSPRTSCQGRSELGDLACG